jgi:hypothetical protein
LRGHLVWDGGAIKPNADFPDPALLARIRACQA